MQRPDTGKLRLSRRSRCDSKRSRRNLNFGGARFVLAVAQASYLETLNPERWQAVEHGVGPEGTVGAPLLVIAGAGSGNTNTLAHRVAHLIVSGADPSSACPKSDRIHQ